MKKTLAVLVCSLAFLNPLTATPASASSCLSKADQAAMTGSNFDFLYMENCYKALGLSSTSSNCSSILNSASNFYKLDWDKDAFRRVMEYDSCREKTSAPVQPAPQPSSSSKPSIAPVVPVKPISPKAQKCTAVPNKATAKLSYMDSRDIVGDQRWGQGADKLPVLDFGTVGFVNVRWAINLQSKSAAKSINVDIKTADTKGKWTSWRSAQVGIPTFPYANGYFFLGPHINPTKVSKVQVRVSLINDCGTTRVELTKTSGAPIWDPALGKPLRVTCRAFDFSTGAKGDVPILGFGDCDLYNLEWPTPQ